MNGLRAFWKKAPRLYKSGGRRAEWKKRSSREAEIMVKGTNRRVVVVRYPDPKMFEEAIFVLRDDGSHGKTAEQVMDEARLAAADYIRSCRTVRKKPGSRRLLYAVIAAAVLSAAGIAYLAVRLLL